MTDLPTSDLLEESSNLLEELSNRIKHLEGEERLLGQIRATLHVNFVNRETYGVRIPNGADLSTSALLVEVLRLLGEKIND